MNNRVLMNSMKYHEHVERIFKKAEREIQADIAMWYSRLAINNNVSYQNAVKLLKQDELKEFHWTVEEYIKHGKENRITKDWHKELENASAKYHITRLESLLFQMKEHVNNLYAGYYEGLFDTLGNTYEQAYYRTAYEIENVTGAKSSFSRLDKDTINKVLETPWASDGRDFSNRLWSDKNKLINNLRTELTIGLIRGDRQEKIVRSFAERMHASLTNAGRLIATESAYFASVGSLDSLKELGVEEYEYLATLDMRTSPMCREMDGKVFKIEDFKPGITAPPLHCWCRSTTVPKMDDEKGVERTARDENNKSVTVPNTTYETWYKERVAKKQTKQVKNDKIKEKKEYKVADSEKIKELQKQSDEVYKKLTKEEREALSEYTQGGYADINNDLAMNVKNRYETDLNNAINKFELKDDIVVYRGTCERYYKDYKVGDIFEGKVFYSTSLDYGQAKAFADDVTEYKHEYDGYEGVLLEIKVPKNSKALYIGGNTDYKDGNYTVNEYELLLSNKIKYKIEKMEKGKIILEVVGFEN